MTQVIIVNQFLVSQDFLQTFVFPKSVNCKFSANSLVLGLLSVTGTITFTLSVKDATQSPILFASLGIII